MKYILLASFVTLIAACSGAPPTPASEVIYQAGSSTPKSFGLDITPAADGNYYVSGKSVTLKDIYWKIRESRHTDAAINTVLYHNKAPGTVMQYMCVISIVYDWRIGGFQETDGVIRPIKVTGNSFGFQIFYKQCMDSIGSH